MRRPVQLGQQAFHRDPVVHQTGAAVLRRIKNTSQQSADDDRVEAWAQRYLTTTLEKVTGATFIMVALDQSGQPTPVPVD